MSVQMAHHYTDTNIHLVRDFLENSSDRLPDKVCLICEGQQLTYQQVEEKANQLANRLIELGIKRGDRVALFLPNSIDLVVAIFAVLKAGAVFVVINNTTKPEKLAYILNNSAAEAFICGAGHFELADQLLLNVRSLTHVLLSGPTSGPFEGSRFHSLTNVYQLSSARRPVERNIDLDLACLIYTSGSTGDPKGVMSDHSNVVFAVRSITSYLQNREDDIVLNVLPLSFDYGLYQLLMVFYFGGTLVLEKGFVFPAAILKRIEEEKVTGFPGVPTVYSLLLDLDLSKYDLSSLRYMTNTAAALPPAHIIRIREKFPHVILFSMYGLTETKRTLYLPPEQLDTRPDSVGIAIPGTEVWLEDENGNRLGPGETGELVIRGRHVMRGYWRDERASSARFRPGSIPGERVCYSGDLFRTDAEGFYYFVGRKDDIIKSRGEKVSPKEVENVIYAMKGVREVAVVGVPDSRLGQAVKAFVVSDDPDLMEADVLRHCRANLEDFMVPKLIELCGELPKTSSGKIKKTNLS